MVSGAEVGLEYVSSGCNRAPHCMAWSNYVYYGSHYGVQVYSVEQARVVTTLLAHTARVNVVRTLKLSVDSEYIVSGSTDHTVAVWECREGRFSKIAAIKAHTGSVTNITLSKEDSVLTVVSTSTDNTVRLSRLHTDTHLLEDDGVIDLGSGLALELHLTFLPGLVGPVLFVARDDCKIHLYHRDGESCWVRSAVIPGHEDWVVSLDTRRLGESVMLVSGGQDSLVRMWRLERSKARVETTELAVEEEVVRLGGQDWVIVLESVLAGHEGWVYSVQWNSQANLLLTASMDKTIMIWGQAEGEEAVWIEQVRVGEVGGNTLGFLGAVWGPGDDRILGHSWGGAFHLWQEAEEGGWRSGVVGGGHQQAVSDLSWEEDGRYLLTVSRDQTARVHALWAGGGTWQEVARPQVHGYDLACCALMSQHRFVSGAEEKLIRAFSAPSNFIENLSRITGSHVSVGRELAQGASTPSLGLSNKAVYQGQKETPVEEKHVKDQFPDHYFIPEVVDSPPAEESLVQNTLWPEEHKLYGHGYELFCVAVSPDSKIVASACKSTDSASSRVILWDTRTWTEVGGISSHSLTVTQMSFSPEGGKLLCVSRDRTWSLHRLSQSLDTNTITTSLLARSDKKSSVISRLIWSCCWSHDSKYFVTASRDKRVVIWGEEEGGWKQRGSVLSLPDSVTAVSLAHSPTEDGLYLLAAGLNSGSIHILTWSLAGGWTERTVLGPATAHHDTVTRLAWRPGSNNYLASSSTDTSVKIYNVKLS